jgi:hypothetical protein
MELEHAFQQSNLFISLQLILAGALSVPLAVGRPDIYRSFIGAAATVTVTFGPVLLLVYVLFEIVRLS